VRLPLFISWVKDESGTGYFYQAVKHTGKFYQGFDLANNFDFFHRPADDLFLRAIP